MKGNLNFFIVLIVFSITSCYRTEEVALELDKIISIEAFQSNEFGRVLVLSTDQYPCVIPGRCEPRPEKNAFISVGIKNDTAQNLLCDVTCSFYFTAQPTSFEPGDTVQFDVQVGVNEYQAESVMPEKDDIVLASQFSLNVNFPGLLIKLDTHLLEGSHGIYLQLITPSDSEVDYGFLVTKDRFASSDLPNNGRYVTRDEFFISNEEIQASGVNVIFGQEYRIIARNLSPESVVYYRKFKELLATGNINLNNGLLFAPPESLPSNFDNNGFGFFHLFYEQTLEGVVM